MPHWAVRTADRHDDVENVSASFAGRSVRRLTRGCSCTAARVSSRSMRCSSAAVADIQFHRRDAGVRPLATELA